MIKEFKEFISRGNVIDLAVAVVIGAAFGVVVTSFVNDILMQIIAAIAGQPSFDSLTIDLGDTAIYYGKFLTALVSFLIIAFAIFLVVKALAKAQAMGREAGDEAGDVAPKSDETVLLEEIRDLLSART